MSAYITINLSALTYNYQLLKKHADPAEVAAVVKADAYGLGASKIVPSLYEAGCRFFFVAHLNEALELKKFLPGKHSIAVLNGITPGKEEVFAQNKIIPVLNSIEMVKSWREYCASMFEKHPAILQIDTGMHRLGLSRDEAEQLSKDTCFFKQTTLLYILSHLANSEDARNEKNTLQYERFCEISHKFPNISKSLANSGAIFLGKPYHFDLVRPGIALYGIDPRPLKTTLIKPVLSLKAPILQIRTLEKGDEIGYNGSFKAKQNMTIATIGLGYADGLPRLLSNKGFGYFKESKLPIIGKISMDSLMLDISRLPVKPLPGDFIEFIGENQTLKTLAADAQTISYEILTGLSPRVKRIYKKE